MINYEAAKKMFPKQKAALTRAQKKGYTAVLATCRKTVKEWNDIFGAWPDDWSLWQRALGDAAFSYARETGQQPSVFRLEEL